MTEGTMVEDRPSWLAWRKDGIGSSDAAAIAGLDPYRGPMGVFLEKTGRLGDADREESQWMRWGRLLEAAIADEFQVRTGLFVRSRQLLVSHPERPWQRATLDGVVTDLPPGLDSNRDAPLGIYESKTVAGWKSDAWADDAIPEHFHVQVLHQLAVTGLTHAWVAVLFGGQRLEIREVDRDEATIESLVALEEAFWFRHVVADIPPAGDGAPATTEALRDAFPGGGGGSVELPDVAEQLLAERVAARTEMKAAEVRAAAAEQALMLAMGAAELGTIAGKVRVTWKAFNQNRVDVDRLKADDPELVKRYLKQTTARRFMVKGEAADG